jgi:hypothetical protein
VCRIAFKQKSKVPKRLKRFCSTRVDLLEVLESTLSNVNAQEKLKKDEHVESDDAHFSDSTLKELIEVYTYKLSQRDQNVLRKIYKMDASLNCLLFKLATQQHSATSDILNKQLKMADFVNAKLDAKTLQASIRNFPFERKVDDLSKEESPSWNLNNDYSNTYDPLYLLPNLFNLLNFGRFFHRHVSFFLIVSFQMSFFVLSEHCRRCSVRAEKRSVISVRRTKQ